MKKLVLVMLLCVPYLSLANEVKQKLEVTATVAHACAVKQNTLNCVKGVSKPKIENQIVVINTEGQRKEYRTVIYIY